MLFRVLLSFVVLAAAASATPFTSLFFFGDSLTDTGNVLKGTSTLNGYTLGAIPRHPTAPYANGRFSDGPVWAEHVAARLGRPADAAPAGMSMGWFGEVGGPGNNYAVGGARTDNGGALGFLDFALPTGIATQVDFYLSRAGGTADSQALYFMLGGGNDLRDAARISDPTQRMLAAQTAGANLAYSVRDLYLAGARNFVLINSPDIGLIPESVGDGVTEAGTHAAVEFNTWFGLYGDYLRNEVPGFSLQYFDLFGLHHDLVAEYGMDPSRSLYFDSVHPAAWVHEIVGNRIADQILGTASMQMDVSSSTQTPEPSTALLTLAATATLLTLRKPRPQKPGQ